MIGIHASVNWNKGKMQVNLMVKGVCEHPLEHLYTECIREGLRGSLRVAQAKELEMAAAAEATNIKIGLPATAAADETPSALSEEAVEIKFPAQTPARPPLFSEFVNGLIADFNRAVEYEKVKPQPDDDVIISAQAAAELVKEHAEAYMQKLLEYHKARAGAGGQS